MGEEQQDEAFKEDECQLGTIQSQWKDLERKPKKWLNDKKIFYS